MSSIEIRKNDGLEHVSVAALRLSMGEDLRKMSADVQFLSQLHGKKLLFVDDCPLTLDTISVEFEALKAFGISVESVAESSPLRALERLRRESFDGVCTDLEMDEMRGTDFLLQAAKEGLLARAVVFSGDWGDAQWAELSSLVSRAATQDEREALIQQVRSKTGGNPLLYVHKGAEGFRTLPYTAAALLLMNGRINEEFDTVLSRIIPPCPAGRCLDDELQKELDGILQRSAEYAALASSLCGRIADGVLHFTFFNKHNQQLGPALGARFAAYGKSIAKCDWQYIKQLPFDLQHSAIHNAFGPMRQAAVDLKGLERSVAGHVHSDQRESFLKWGQALSAEMTAFYCAMRYEFDRHWSVHTGSIEAYKIIISSLLPYEKDLPIEFHLSHRGDIANEHVALIHEISDLCMGNAQKALSASEGILKVCDFDPAPIEDLPEDIRKQIHESEVEVAGGFYKVQFADRGIGMTAEELAAVRNQREGSSSFWETKGISGGTGWGLRRVDTVLREIGGAWSIESEGRGQGTTVTMYIPVVGN